MARALPLTQQEKLRGNKRQEHAESTRERTKSEGKTSNENAGRANEERRKLVQEGNKTVKRAEDIFRKNAKGAAAGDGPVDASPRLPLTERKVIRRGHPAHGLSFSNLFCA